MSFQLRFEDPASADLTHVVRAIERNLNWQGVQSQGSVGATSSSAASATCPKGENCGTIIIGHPHPNFIDLVIVAVVAFIIGVVVGRASAGARSTTTK